MINDEAWEHGKRARYVWRELHYFWQHLIMPIARGRREEA